MNRKKLAIILITLLLVQSIPAAKVFCEETAPLNPSARAPSICFRQIYSIMCVALSIYKADAVNRFSKEDLARRYGGLPAGESARFDLARIDMGKRGWTRYYPFRIGGRDFIARVFLTEERFYQPPAPILFQAEIDNPAVTIQILPGVNELLSECRIRPHPPIYPTTAVAASP